MAAIETGRDELSPQEARFEFGPFGRLDARVSGGPVWTKWRALADEIESDLRALSACEQKPETCTGPALGALLSIVTAARDRNGRARLGVINRAVNLAIRPASDLRQHGVPDRWSGPLATFSSGQGDCEDYAIAKYVALRASGMSAEDLRLVIVRDTGMRQDHAVLTVRLDGRWLVLDNRRFALVEDHHATQYVPLFALDMSGVSRFAGSNSILRRRTAPTG